MKSTGLIRLLLLILIKAFIQIIGPQASQTLLFELPTLSRIADELIILYPSELTQWFIKEQPNQSESLVQLEPSLLKQSLRQSPKQSTQQSIQQPLPSNNSEVLSSLLSVLLDVIPMQKTLNSFG